MPSKRRVAASARSLVALYTVLLAIVAVCCSSDQSIGGSGNAAVVQPFQASSQASDFVNEVITTTTIATTTTTSTKNTTSASTGEPATRESDFENTAMSAGDEAEIVGNLQTGSYSGLSTTAVGDSAATSTTATELSATTTNEDEAEGSGNDSGDSSQVATLSAGAVAGVLCVGAVLVVPRRRRWHALNSPGTPPEKATYFHVQKQLTPPPV